MGHVYRFEIYPNQHSLKNVTANENALKKWFKDFTQTEFERIFEVRYFLVETDEKIEGIHAYASEVFTDSVTETLFSSESTNSEEYHGWIKEKGFTRPFMIDIGFRPGVTDN